MYTNDAELLSLTPDEFMMLEPWELEVDWRFTMACKGKRTWYEHIKFVTEMMTFLRNPDQYCNDDTDLLLAQGCYQIHKNDKKRIMTEAYILAGATNEYLLKQYPQKAGSDVFKWYRKLFFSIEDYQHFDELLLARVIGPLQNKHIKAQTKLVTLEFLSKKLAMLRDPSLIDDFNDVLNNKPASDALKTAFLNIAEASTIIADIIKKFELTDAQTELGGSFINIASASKALAKRRDKHNKFSKTLKRLFDGLC